MSNTGEFYTNSGYPSQGAAGSSASMRAELNSIVTGFNKLPSLTSNNNKHIKVSSDGTNLEHSNVISDDGTNATIAGNTIFSNGTIGANATNRHTIPATTSDTLVLRTATQTLTNKTISAANNTITTAASGNLTSTNLNAALAELQNDIDTRLSGTALSDHTGASSGAHAASAITNTPSGNLVAINVQSALNELQGDINSLNAALYELSSLNLIGANTTLTNSNQWGVLHYVTTTTTLTITLASPSGNTDKLVYFSNITGNIVFITTPSGVINAQGLSATTIALGRGESLVLTTDGTNYIQVARNGNGVMDLTSYTGTDIELAVGQTALYIPTAVTSQMLRLRTSDNQVYTRYAQDTGTIAGVNANIELQMNNTDYVGAHVHRVYVVDFATSAANASGVTINRFGLNVRPSGYAIPYSCEIYTAAASRRKTVSCAFGEFSSTTQTQGGSFLSVNDNAVAWTSMGTELYGRTYSGIISYTRIR